MEMAVIIPIVPSEPMKSCLMSKPMTEIRFYCIFWIAKRLTCVIFPELAQAVPDGSVRQNNFQTKDGAVQASVPQQPQTASVGSDVTSDVT